MLMEIHATGLMTKVLMLLLFPSITVSTPSAFYLCQLAFHVFGGDPSRVTINGQSAGGSSVQLLHWVPHESRNLFSGDIAQGVYRAPLPIRY